MIRKLKIAHSKWLLLSDGETLLVHMELILFTKGVAAGGSRGHKGAPSNMILMCLPPDPMCYSDMLAYAVEYQTSGILNHVHNNNMPCSLCEATGRDDKIMIPSHYVCPDGWHKEYNGYIMSGHYNQEGSSMHYCIDENLEQIKGTRGDDSGYYLYTVYASLVICTSRWRLCPLLCSMHKVIIDYVNNTLYPQLGLSLLCF